MHKQQSKFYSLSQHVSCLSHSKTLSEITVSPLLQRSSKKMLQSDDRSATLSKFNMIEWRRSKYEPSQAERRLKFENDIVLNNLASVNRDKIRNIFALGSISLKLNHHHRGEGNNVPLINNIFNSYETVDLILHLSPKIKSGSLWVTMTNQNSISRILIMDCGLSFPPISSHNPYQKHETDLQAKYLKILGELLKYPTKKLMKGQRKYQVNGFVQIDAYESPQIATRNVSPFLHELLRNGDQI